MSLGGISGTDDALNKALDALTKIEDPARRAAAAADLFGRFGGAEMVAALGLADRIVTLQDGRIVRDEKPATP